jgi:hypothetical protein
MADAPSLQVGFLLSAYARRRSKSVRLQLAGATPVPIKATKNSPLVITVMRNYGTGPQYDLCGAWYILIVVPCTDRAAELQQVGLAEESVHRPRRHRRTRVWVNPKLDRRKNGHEKKRE